MTYTVTRKYKGKDVDLDKLAIFMVDNMDMEQLLQFAVSVTRTNLEKLVERDLVKFIEESGFAKKIESESDG